MPVATAQHRTTARRVRRTSVAHRRRWRQRSRAAERLRRPRSPDAASRARPTARRDAAAIRSRDVPDAATARDAQHRRAAARGPTVRDQRVPARDAGTTPRPRSCDRRSTSSDTARRGRPWRGASPPTADARSRSAISSSVIEPSAGSTLELAITHASRVRSRRRIRSSPGASQAPAVSGRVSRCGGRAARRGDRRRPPAACRCRPASHAPALDARRCRPRAMRIRPARSSAFSDARCSRRDRRRQPRSARFGAADANGSRLGVAFATRLRQPARLRLMRAVASRPRTRDRAARSPSERRARAGRQHARAARPQDGSRSARRSATPHVARHCRASSKPRRPLARRLGRTGRAGRASAPTAPVPGRPRRCARHAAREAAGLVLQRALTTTSRPGGRLVVMKEPAATYSPRPVKAKYHRRCGA